MYVIHVEQPVVFIWAGKFVKGNRLTWKHRHSEHSENFELLIMTRGEIDLSLNGELVTVHQGEYLMIPPHSVIEGATESRDALEMLWLHFIAPYFLDDTKRIQTESLSKVLNKEYADELNEFVFLPEKGRILEYTQISLLFHQLLSSLMKYQYTQKNRDYLCTLVLMAISQDFLDSLAARSEAEDKSIQIAEWIRVNMDDELTVNDVADHFGLNPSYLSRLFRKERHMTVKEYILLQKIETAKNLLVSTDETIARICEMAYCHDEKHFMRIFKQKTGLTPTEFRRSMNKEHMNTEKVDPASQLPAQLGNSALKQYIAQIVAQNEKQRKAPEGKA